MNTHYILILSLLLSGAPMINAKQHHANCSDCPDKEEKDKVQKRSVAVSEPAASAQPEVAEAKCACGGTASGKPLTKDDPNGEQEEQAKCGCSAKPLPKPPRVNVPANAASSQQAAQEKVDSAPAVAAIAEKCGMHHDMNSRCPECPKEPKDQN